MSKENNFIADIPNAQLLLPSGDAFTFSSQNPVEGITEISVETTQRPEISAYTQILAGLKFRKDLIKRLFREGMMRESVIYQEILEEGEQRGEKKGERRERSLVLRLLTRKLGELPSQIHEQVETLSLEELENLGEALLGLYQFVRFTGMVSQ